MLYSSKFRRWTERNCDFVFHPQLRRASVLHSAGPSGKEVTICNHELLKWLFL